MTPGIAIVGIACRYPDAASPDELWENVLTQRQSFRRMPPDRLRFEDYVSTDRLATDMTYTAQAALIEGYEFDRERFRVVGSTYRATDLAHWLALDVASQALENAGFPDAEGLPRETTGVLVGNTLTGEFSRAAVMRLRWPYVGKIVNAKLIDEGWDSQKRAEFLSELEVRYKKPFPVVGDETLAGGLSNTIAGRICNYFDLGGGGYTVDGACSSSLLSITNACSALVAGDLEVVIVGGVDLSLDPFELVGFSRLGALAEGEMRVYDANPTGFLPGEGCGFVVLMQHEEALARKLHIYAVIRGWGISSDGSGGLTRPEVPGQKLALRRAYKRAGYGIDSVAYFEGHGTGTGIGDTVELTALTEVIRESAAKQPAAVVGSIKANIGHTKAAAGMAGLLKAIMAVRSQIIPPNTSFKEPHPVLNGEAPALRLLTEGEVWNSDRSLRAGVSSMGFGGINVHVTVEGVAQRRRTSFTPAERTLLTAHQDAELILLGGRNREDLAEQVQHLLTIVPRLSPGELGDLAALLASRLDERHVRAAIVASHPDELTTSLHNLAAWLRDGVDNRIDVEAGLFVGEGTSRPNITYLFPGQATPAHLDGGAMRRRFDFVTQLYQMAQLSTDSDGVETSVAQPAIATGSMAALRLLTRIGVRATNAVGHSLGELTALHWAGVYDEAGLLRIATARGKAMTEHCAARGAMASIGADEATVEKMLDDDGVVIAGLNSPHQTVVSGHEVSVTALISRAQAKGLRAVRLPVSHAFHSPLLVEAEKALEQFLASENFKPIEATVVSTITGKPLSGDGDLKALLCRQITAPVRFMEALLVASKEADLLIEVGPGEVLGGIAAGQVTSPVISMDAAGLSLKGILQAVGAAYALGAEIDQKVLFEGRFTRPFDLDWQPRFFVNPCELAPDGDDHRLPVSQSQSLSGSSTYDEFSSFEMATTGTDSEPIDVLSLVRHLVAAKVELPLSAITGDSRLLDDLHLNSITVSRIVVEAARRLQLPPVVSPSQFASATVAQVAEALERLRDTGELSSASPEPGQVPGVDSWVRCLTLDLVEKPLPSGQPAPERSKWKLYAPHGHILAESIKRELESWGGGGVIICIPPEPDENHIGLMLQGAQAALESSEPTRLVFIQHGGGAVSLAKTTHLEATGLTTCVIDVPYSLESLTWIVDEVKAGVGYSESCYDRNGVRRVPVLRVLPITTSSKSPLPVGKDDLLLVTGGGKGIGAECALSLAKETGVRLALMGRSQPAEDDELAANLKRFTAAGIEFEYIAADVTDAATVKEALEHVQESLGNITAFLHAAGTNVPQLLRTLDENSFQRTLAPKVLGAKNVLAAIDREKLRLFITFGSIIARTGMRGEADYAVANEWLSRLTEEFQVDYPSCRCLAVEWSVWSGVGMGERLGRVQELARDGISAITPDAGLAVIQTLLHHKLSSPSVVVTGRFGKPPTLAMEESQLPLLRFLEHQRVFYPGIELIFDAELTLDTDPYLQDHVFRGQRLLPAVMGLEAMAQAAMAVADRTSPPVFEDVKFDRPVVLPDNGKLTIRLAALVRESGQVEVVLRSEETSFSADHFRAVCKFEDNAKMEKESPIEHKVTGIAVPLKPQTDLYGSLLFHQGRFRRLGGYRHLASTECVAEIVPDGQSAWFGSYLPLELILGDPALRDTAIHAIQACVPDISLLPIGVERIQVGIRSTAGPWLMHAVERTHDKELFIYDVEVSEQDGRVIERWEGLRLKTIAGTEHEGNWVAPLLGPYLERKVREYIPAAEVSVAVDIGFNDNRRNRSDRAIRRVLGCDVSVTRRPDGKPEVSGNINVSTSHAGDITMAVAGRGAVGCDTQPVVERPEEEWRNLLGPEKCQLAATVAREAGEDKATAATRIWAVAECLIKVGANTDTPLILERADRDSWVLFTSGHYKAATLVASITGCDRPLVLAVMVRSNNASL